MGNYLYPLKRTESVLDGISPQLEETTASETASETVFKYKNSNHVKVCSDITKNPFLRLSYFEFFGFSGFISKYPSTLTEPVGITVTNTTLPFDRFYDAEFTSIKEWGKLFDSYMMTLYVNNFGINDIFWWLPNTQESVKNSETLLNYIRNTNVTFGEINNHHQCVVITNNLVPEFSLNAFFTDSPLPQEAIDVIPYFTLKGRDEVYSALGYKKETPRINVNLCNGETLAILSTGIYGNVIFGEHIEKNEKDAINSTSKAFFDNNKSPVSVQHSKMSPALRTLSEEAGFDTTSIPEMFYIGMSRTGLDEKCRDPRYGELYSGATKVYGYPRVSTAHTLCCIFNSDPPKNPIPKDVKECSKPVILPSNVIEANFKDGGLFAPAFSSHAEQFRQSLEFVKFRLNSTP